MAQDAVKPAAKNRYRKIEVRMWGDTKFRDLSPIPPCGQGLWIFLLTGPHTGPIPGLFRSGRAAMAEELNWELEAFDKAFTEAFQQGMVKADWKAKVVWVPKAILCNKPESPNVVTSWGAEWDLIPECDLKQEAFIALRGSIGALGEPYAKSFDKAFGKPSGKPSLKATFNQEQEQEQEQDSKKTPIPPEGGTPSETPKKERKKREGEPLQAYLDRCKAESVKPIPADDPIFEYVREVGLTDEMLVLAWFVFKTRYLDKKKLQKDWLAHYRNAVKSNWFKLWFLGNDGAAGLTTAGVQAQREMEAKNRKAA
jgi:hypothetical protein